MSSTLEFDRVLNNFGKTHAFNNVSESLSANTVALQLEKQQRQFAHSKKIEAYKKKLLTEIETRRNILVEKVKEKLGWEMKHPGGAIYAIIPLSSDLITKFGDVDTFALDLVDKGGVSAISGTVFEFRTRPVNGGYEVYTPDATSPEVSYLRFCFGFTPQDRVGLAVDHIKNFISNR